MKLDKTNPRGTVGVTTRANSLRRIFRIFLTIYFLRFDSLSLAKLSSGCNPNVDQSNKSIIRIFFFLFSPIARNRKRPLITFQDISFPSTHVLASIAFRIYRECCLKLPSIVIQLVCKIPEHQVRSVRSESVSPKGGSFPTCYMIFA